MDRGDGLGGAAVQPLKPADTLCQRQPQHSRKAARPFSARRQPKALAEHSREMHGILKAASIRDVANASCGLRIADQQAAYALQSKLADIIGHGLTMLREYAAKVSARAAELTRDQLGVQMVRSQVSFD